METSNYRKLFNEIVNGYSPCLIKEEEAYIKHQSVSDLVDYESVYDLHLNRAKLKGLPTKEEVFDNLNEEGIWTKSDDSELDSQKFYIQSLIKNKKNVFLKSAVDSINKQIKEAENKYLELSSKKSNLISNCCETYALNRANDHYMFSSFHRDKALREKFYSQEEYEYMGAKEVGSLVKIYNEFYSNFSEKNIQNLVLQDFYKIYYSFSETTTDFFGIPVVKLNSFQLNLIIYTRIFKNIFDTSDEIPDRIKNDPEALLDFANSSDARNEMKNKMSDDSSASTIVGATKEDLDELGLSSNGGKSLEEAVKKKGGSLSMKDLIDLGGH